MPSGVVREREADAEAERPPASPPSKIARLYPPQHAGIQTIEAHGDDEMDGESIAEELNEELLYADEEEDEPPSPVTRRLQMMEVETRRRQVKKK